ncbi:MAG TPA: PIN domain-containing protein [Candidatus Saccharimonadales bacterium]|nr:PIN domain-containing protein [Candidatus Saccharimonadales bacterium]
MNELLLDSNIILRHLLQDIPLQSTNATELIDSIEKGEKVGFLSILVINEVIWILKRFYKIERKNFLPQLITILQINNIKCLEIKKANLIKILERMKKREIDFTDVYLSEIAGNRKIASFDKDFKKLIN